MIHIKKKICLLGNVGVGKTSLIRRFVHNIFDDSYLTTIGVKISQKDIERPDRKLTLMIWDVEGFETPESNTQNYFTGSTGAVIVADLTRQDTIDSLKQTVEFVKGLNPKTVVFLAGNKSDLVEEKHPANLALEQLSQTLKLPLFFTSAKDGQNVELCFNQLAEHILAKQ